MWSIPFISRSLPFRKLSYIPSGVFSSRIFFRAFGAKRVCEIADNNFRCWLDSTSGAIMKTMSFVFSPSRESKSTPDGTVIIPTTKSLADFRRQWGMAIPLPMPVEPRASRACRPSRISS